MDIKPGDTIGDGGFGVTYTAGVQDENGDWTYDESRNPELQRQQREKDKKRKRGAGSQAGGMAGGWGRGRGFGA